MDLRLRLSKTKKCSSSSSIEDEEIFDSYPSSKRWDNEEEICYCSQFFEIFFLRKKKKKKIEPFPIPTFQPTQDSDISELDLSRKSSLSEVASESWIWVDTLGSSRGGSQEMRFRLRRSWCPLPISIRSCFNSSFGVGAGVFVPQLALYVVKNSWFRTFRTCYLGGPNLLFVNFAECLL